MNWLATREASGSAGVRSIRSVARAETLADIGNGLDGWIVSFDLSAAGWALIANGDDTHAIGLRKVAHQIRTPVTVADNANS